MQLKAQNLFEGDDYSLNIQIDALKEELAEKADDLNDMENLNQTLILREHMSNVELQDARKELISVRIWSFMVLKCWNENHIDNPLVYGIWFYWNTSFQKYI